MTLWGRLDLQHMRGGVRFLGMTEEFGRLVEAARREVEDEGRESGSAGHLEDARA